VRGGFARGRHWNAGRGSVSLNTENLEPVTGLGVDKVLALDLERSHSGGGAGEGTDGREETSVGLYRGGCQRSVLNSDFAYRAGLSSPYGNHLEGIVCETEE
jgi:hypothetical protein